MKRTGLFFLLALMMQSALAQDLNKARLDSFFLALETHNKCMGSVAISRDGKLIYSKSIGFAELETKTRANEKTRYRIGSISKTFTAVLIFKAIEEKKLNLDQSLDSYFPGIPNAGKIKISQLLNHRSGIHNFTDDAEYVTWNSQPKTEAEMLAIIIKGGSDFEPDSKAEYSNSNYVLLSYILEKTYKKSYAELLNKQIIKPLGLMNTAVGQKINAKNKDAYSYSYAGKWEKESETDMSVPMGAGSIISTPIDLTLFASALFEGKLLSAKSLEQMKTIKEDYGMGLFQIPFNEKKGFGHTGGIDGFSSVFCYFPGDKIAYAFTSNGSNYINNKISIAALSAVFKEPYEIPEFKTINLSAADLDQYLGVYISKEIGLMITITKTNNVLMAQASGQQAFGLEPIDKNIFAFEKAGVVVEFDPEEKELTLKQGGGSYTFTKSKNH